MNNFKKIALGAALLTASAASYANLPFTVDNSLGMADTGDATTTFVTDKITGFYNEIVVVNNNAGQFSATIVLTYTSFTDTFGIDAGLADGDGTGYGLYSVINIDGNVLSNVGGSITTGNWSGDFNLFLDVETDTNSDDAVIAGINNVSFSAAELDDDLELLSGSIGTGGSVGNTSSGGFFLESQDFSLTAAGSAFFIEPDPFYSMLISTGDLEDFFSRVDFTLLNEAQAFEGEASVVFNVPEPSAIALIGLGLFALGFRARK